MPLSTMAAVMLIIALACGLINKTLESLRAGRFYALAFIILAALLRIADISFSPEYELNLGCVFTAAVLFFVCAALEGKSCLRACAAAAVCAVPAVLIMRLANRDAAVLLAGLVPLASMAVERSAPRLLLTAALMPVFTAAFAFLLGYVLTGYGTFELTGSMLDLQWIGILFIVLFLELVPRAKAEPRLAQ